MNNRIFTENGKQYKRIDKRQARRAFCDQKTIFVCASNLNPFGVWHPSIDWNINKETFQDELKTGKTPEKLFDYTVNQFEFYNCINSETGLYSAFYIEV